MRNDATKCWGYLKRYSVKSWSLDAKSVVCVPKGSAFEFDKCKPHEDESTSSKTLLDGTAIKT